MIATLFYLANAHFIILVSSLYTPFPCYFRALLKKRYQLLITILVSDMYIIDTAMRSDTVKAYQIKATQLLIEILERCH